MRSASFPRRVSTPSGPPRLLQRSLPARRAASSLLSLQTSHRCQSTMTAAAAAHHVPQRGQTSSAAFSAAAAAVAGVTRAPGPDASKARGDGTALPLPIHEYFVVEEAADLDMTLITEARRKHGVWMNVPPQLPPSTDAAVATWLTRFDTVSAANDKHDQDNDNAKETGEAEMKPGASHFPVRYSRRQYARMQARPRQFTESDAAILDTRARTATMQLDVVRSQRSSAATPTDATTAASASVPLSPAADGVGSAPAGGGVVFTNAVHADTANQSEAALDDTTSLNGRPAFRAGRRTAGATASADRQGSPLTTMLPPRAAPPQVPDIHLLFLQHQSSPFFQSRGQTSMASDAKTAEDESQQPWAYIPTYLPPPLVTTGTRALIPVSSASPSSVPRLSSASTTTASATTPIATTTTTTTTTTTRQTIAKRAPIDETMSCHCTVCGKAYRRRDTALDHVRVRHKTQTSSSPSFASSALTSTAAAEALVGDGPGPGELLAYEDVVVTLVRPNSNATNNTTINGSRVASPSSPSPVEPATMINKATESSLKPTLRAYTDTPLITLPDDALVDAVLMDVWDVIAAGRDDLSHQAHLTHVSPQTPRGATPSDDARQTLLTFIPASALVTANVDRRAEMQAEAATAQPARATPEGAAPGIKRRLNTTPNARVFDTIGRHVDKLTGSPSTGALLSNRERRKRFPNPFGDSPNAQVTELEKEPVNPFMSLDEEAASWKSILAADDTNTTTSGGSVPGLSSASDSPNGHAAGGRHGLTCPLCRRTAQAEKAKPTRTFRLLDALLDHVTYAHAAQGGLDALNEADWASLRHSSSASSIMNTGKTTTTTTTTKAQDEVSGALTSENGSDETVSGRSDENADSSSPGASSSSSSSSQSSSAAPSPPHSSEPAQIHARMATNMIVVGTVRDVQHGFLGSDPVLQYVVETVAAPPSSSSSAESEKAASTSAETELIVVRCVGPHVPVALLQQQIRFGSRVYVSGTLMMNRHVDSASRRLHAYPFVRVTPPLGIVKVL